MQTEVKMASSRYKTFFSFSSSSSSSSSFAVSSSTPNFIVEQILDCISTHFPQSSTANLVYSHYSPTFPSVLHSSIQNLRFYNTSPSHQPKVIITPYNNLTHVRARIRSGGHDCEGLSYRSHVTPSVIIDLVHLNKIRVDTNQGTAWVQSGATLGVLYYHVSKSRNGSLGFPGGTYPSMGAGGFISPFMRKFGLSADNVVDATLVNADGKVFDRKTMGEEWFWAIRGGGGGNFGVVVEWKIKLFKVPHKVTGFNIRKLLENNATKLIHRWQDIAHRLHENLFIIVVMSVVKDSKGRRTIQANFDALFLGTIDQLAWEVLLDGKVI